MTITQPTGQLFTDLVLFGLFFAYALGVVWVGTELQERKGKK
jgi:hypothetical protein